MKIRAISIDDDPVAIMMVKKLCETVPNIELVNTYNNPISGAAGIVLDRPDLLFLDIEMPEFDGVKIMESLVRPPKIIVISSNESYTEKALELNAITFLKKPVSVEDFQSAISEYIKLIG